MRGFNRVILIGNCTRDPEVKYLTGDTMVANLGIAMNRKWTTQDGQEKEEVTFVDLAAFGKLAEIFQKYVTKGKAIMVEGRLKFDQRDDQQGNKRSKLSVVVENMTLLGGNPNGGDGDNGAGRDDGEEYQEQQAPPPRQQQQRPQQQQQQRPQQGRQQAPPPRQQQQQRGGAPQKFRDADIPF